MNLSKKALFCILLVLGMSTIQSKVDNETVQKQSTLFSLEFAQEVIKSMTTQTLASLAAFTACYCMYEYLERQHYPEDMAENDQDDAIEGNDKKKEFEAFMKEAASFISIHYPGTIKTTLQDVAGNESAKADIEDIILYLQYPEKFIAMGAKIPKGLLMSGGPGTGKTLMARAVAGQVDCPFLSLNGSSFAEMYVGVGARRVRILFRLAQYLSEKHGACLIFIDEIDAVAQKRSGSGGVGDRDFNQTIAQLLESMDGLQENKNPIIVFAATNRPDSLDPAIVRPGRLDRKVEVKKPEIKDRVTLLSKALQSVAHVNTLDISRFARITAGFSGAQLTQLINEAAIIAVRDDRSIVTIDDIELAYDHITLGREILGMELNEDDKWVTAIHEAGHAIGYLFGDCHRFAIHKASIVPRANALGVVWAVLLHESHSYVEEDMRAKIVVALCGSLAEQEFGYSKSTGPSSDLAHARAIAYDMVVRYGMSKKMSYISYDEIDHYLPNDIATEIHREVQKIVDECLLVAQKIIASHKDDIKNIAHLLMEKGTVLGDEMYALVNLPIPSSKLDIIS